jgi:coatomer subunit alpha
VLTGHNHYVMCARFHPSEDLVLSASLDQSVRVWDISGLRKKNVSITPDFGAQSQNNAANDLFGTSDVVVKHVLEGHIRGVNWATFHPTMPLIASGADDREVKIWRMNDIKAWEVDTLRGHTTNVSCVLFHPRKELLISNSEDKSIRVWDIQKNHSPQTIRRDADRYWILAAHPRHNLLAAGHDSGLIIFKLNRERPPMDVRKKEVFYYKDMFIRRHDIKTGQDEPLLTTRRRSNSSSAEEPFALTYNASNRSQHCFLMMSVGDGTTYYDLYVMNKASSGSSESSEVYRGVARAAVFVSRNRFCVLDKYKHLWLKDLKNETKKRINPIKGLYVNHLFPGGTGRVLLRTPDSMVLYDIQVMKIINTLPIASRHPVKYVSWSQTKQYVAMFSKANIYITDDQLNEKCQINETSRIKSGAWDSSGVFVYTTATHVKYLLPNGDMGIIRTLDTPIYVTHASPTEIHFIDREHTAGVMQIDSTEYRFKQALVKRQHKEVLRIMHTGKLVGQSIIAYLQQKNHPEVALHFVKDLKTKFSLALECGSIVRAMECAEQLDDQEAWQKLAAAAIRLGDHQAVEKAYQRTKNFERLSFLYLIIGQTDKLSKMLRIATIREDMMGRFHNALYLGDAAERVNVLRDAGQIGLAYITAKSHGLEEQLTELEEQFADSIPEAAREMDVSNASLLYPPIPIVRQESNWPLEEVKRGYFDGPPGEELPPVPDDSDEDEEKDMNVDDLVPSSSAPGWGDMDLGINADGASDAGAAGGAPGGAGWGDLGDLGIDVPDIGDDFGDMSLGDTAASADMFIMPSNGRTISNRWSDNATLAPHQIAAGAMDLAAHLLHRQIGVVDFEPLRPSFLAIHNSARAWFTAIPGSDPLETGLEESAGKPVAGFALASCVTRLKIAMKAFTDGKFEGALDEFCGILHTIPLVVAESKSQEGEATDLISMCREYILAIRLELARRQSKDPVRQCELAAYFTKCALRPLHQVLGLKVAIKCAFAVKNFRMAGGFCRRVIETCMSASNKQQLERVVNLQQIKGVLKHCEKNDNDAHGLDFKENVAFDVCAESMKALPRSTSSTACPYCHAAYNPSYDGTICRICKISQIGSQATGLKLYAEDTA